MQGVRSSIFVVFHDTIILNMFILIVYSHLWIRWHVLFSYYIITSLQYNMVYCLYSYINTDVLNYWTSSRLPVTSRR
jgi:hypothetical protein